MAIVENDTFETGTDGWTTMDLSSDAPTVTPCAQSSAQAHSGTYSLLCTPNGVSEEVVAVNGVVSTVAGGIPGGRISGGFAALPGVTYSLLGMWVYETYAFSTTTAIGFGFFDSSGTRIDSNISNPPVSPTAWVNLGDASLNPAPPGTAWGMVWVWPQNLSGDIFYIDDVTVITVVTGLTIGRLRLA